MRHWLGVQQYRMELQDVRAVWSALAYNGNSAPGTIAGAGVFAVLQAWQNVSKHRDLGLQ